MDSELLKNGAIVAFRLMNQYQAMAFKDAGGRAHPEENTMMGCEGSGGRFNQKKKSPSSNSPQMYSSLSNTSHITFTVIAVFFYLFALLSQAPVAHNLIRCILLWTSFSPCSYGIGTVAHGVISFSSVEPRPHQTSRGAPFLRRWLFYGDVCRIAIAPSYATFTQRSVLLCLLPGPRKRRAR